jgi:NADH-quinone oxidoreductase subunit J
MYWNWVTGNWPELLALALMACGVWWLMPGTVRLPKIAGLLLAIGGAGWLVAQLHAASGALEQRILFVAFATAAILAAVLMITNRNPVYSALWFALATLAVCGLFLMQSAPFLAAATVIVYAGAIVVTFVFVIMLAQQSGATVYDQRSRQPLLGTVFGLLLLGALMAMLKTSSAEDLHFTDGQSPVAAANVLSQPAKGEQLGAMLGLGRSLFGDYLFAVELAGTLLLVATIGAIAIAPRRRGGTL